MSILKAGIAAALIAATMAGSASAGTASNVTALGAVAGGGAVAHAINTSAGLTVFGSKASTATLLGSGTLAKAAFVVGGAATGAAVAYVGYRVFTGIGSGINKMFRTVAHVD